MGGVFGACREKKERESLTLGKSSWAMPCFPQRQLEVLEMSSGRPGLHTRKTYSKTMFIPSLLKKTHTYKQSTDKGYSSRLPSRAVGAPFLLSFTEPCRKGR